MSLRASRSWVSEQYFSIYTMSQKIPLLEKNTVKNATKRRNQKTAPTTPKSFSSKEKIFPQLFPNDKTRIPMPYIPNQYRGNVLEDNWLCNFSGLNTHKVRLAFSNFGPKLPTFLPRNNLYRSIFIWCLSHTNLFS